MMGCSKTSDDVLQQTPNGNITGSYELKMQSQSQGSPDKFYWMTFTQNGTTVVGDIAVNDSGKMVTGAVNGTVNQGNFNLTMDLGNPEHSFTYSGSFDPTKVPTVITGTITLSQKKSSGNASFQATIFAIEDWHCHDTSGRNPYVFKRVLTAQNPTGPPVIFVHGMTGHMFNWDTVVMNLSSEFKAKHDVWEFQYDWKDSININGKALLDSVTRYGLVNPILVAHSMGGLVSRAYIANGGSITKLVTLGTPHLGTPLVDFIGFFCTQNYPGSRDMKANGAFIQGLLHNPNDLANRSKYYMIAGEITGSFKIIKFVPTWVWGQAFYATTDKLGYALIESVFHEGNDGLVPVKSAKFEGGGVNNPLEVLPVDHLSMLHCSVSPDILNYINGL